MILLLFATLNVECAKGKKDYLTYNNDWKNLKDLIPSIFKRNKKMSKTGNAGIFAGSLELVKEGNIKLKQDKTFGDIYIRINE